MLHEKFSFCFVLLFVPWQRHSCSHDLDGDDNPGELEGDTVVLFPSCRVKDPDGIRSDDDAKDS